MDNSTHPVTSDSSIETDAVTAIKPKKIRSKKPFIILGAALVLIAILSLSSIFAFGKERVVNSIALTTLNTPSYYAFVEQKNVNKVVDTLIDSYQHISNQLSNVSYSEGSSTINNTIRLGVPVLELLEIDSLKNIQINTSSSMKEGKIITFTELIYGGESLITMETYLDIDKTTLYLRFPEVSSDYIEITLDETYTQYYYLLQNLGATINLPDKNFSFSYEDASKLIKRYAQLFIKSLSNITLDKSTTISINDTSQECSKITIDVSLKELTGVLYDLLKEMKSDKDLIAFANSSLHISRTELISTLSSLRSALDYVQKNISDSYRLSMEVYINDLGEIIGRTFTTNVFNTPITFEYKMTVNKELPTYEAILSYGKNQLISMIGSHQKVENRYGGNVLLNFDLTPLIPEMSLITMEMSYRDIVTSKERLSGTFEILLKGLTSDEYQMNLFYDGTSNNFSYNIDVFENDLLLAGLTTKNQFVTTDSDFTFVDETATIVNIKDYESNLNSSKLAAFLQRASEILGESVYKKVIPDSFVDTTTVPIILEEESPDNTSSLSIKDITIENYVSNTDNPYEGYILPGKYIGLELTNIIPTITKEDILREIDLYLESNATLVPVNDRGVTTGDIVTIDYTLFYDDTTEIYESDNAVELVVGDGLFYEEIEAALMGSNIGDAITTNVNTLNYNNDSNDGLTLNCQIVVTQIAEKVKAEFNDEFAVSIGYESAADMEETIVSYLSHMDEEEYEYQCDKQLFDEIMKDSVWQKDISSYQTLAKEAYISLIKAKVDSDGMNFKSYIRNNYGSMEQFEVIASEYAEKTITRHALLLTIAKTENITLSNKEYLDTIQTYLDGSTYTMEELLSHISPDFLYQAALAEKTFQFIRANTIIH